MKKWLKNNGLSKLKKKFKNIGSDLLLLTDDDLINLGIEETKARIKIRRYIRSLKIREIISYTDDFLIAIGLLLPFYGFTIPFLSEKSISGIEIIGISKKISEYDLPFINYLSILPILGAILLLLSFLDFIYKKIDFSDIIRPHSFVEGLLMLVHFVLHIGTIILFTVASIQIFRGDDVRIVLEDFHLHIEAINLISLFQTGFYCLFAVACFYLLIFIGLICYLIVVVLSKLIPKLFNLFKWLGDLFDNYYRGGTSKEKILSFDKKTVLKQYTEKDKLARILFRNESYIEKSTGLKKREVKYRNTYNSLFDFVQEKYEVLNYIHDDVIQVKQESLEKKESNELVLFEEKKFDSASKLTKQIRIEKDDEDYYSLEIKFFNQEIEVQTSYRTKNHFNLSNDIFSYKNGVPKRIRTHTVSFIDYERKEKLESGYFNEYSYVPTNPDNMSLGVMHKKIYENNELIATEYFVFNNYKFSHRELIE